jgi:hypothetical protein
MPLVVVGFALDSLIAGRTDGYGWLAQASMCLAGMLQSWLGAVLLVRMLRRWFDPATALVTTLAAVLATSLVYYTLVSPTYAHASSFFAVTAFLSVWLATRDRLLPRGAALLGLAGGLMAMVRWQEVLFGLIPALALVARFTAARTNPAERRRIATFVAIALAAAALAFSPQTWVWHEIYGKWLTIPQGDTWVRWTRPDVAAALFSLDDGGLFTWTPFTLFGIVGLAWFRRREPGLTLALALVFALQVYVEGTVHHGLGSSYGSRRLIGATAIFAVGFAALSDELRARRRGWMALVLSSVLVGWNGLLLVEYQWLVHSPGRHGPYPTLRELVTHTPFRR